MNKKDLTLSRLGIYIQKFGNICAQAGHLYQIKRTLNVFFFTSSVVFLCWKVADGWNHWNVHY